MMCFVCLLFFFHEFFLATFELCLCSGGEFWSPETHRTAMAPKYDGLSHCKLALVFAVLMDLLGVTSLLLGVFAPLEIRGRDFGDFLVYSGALLVLLSLACWVLWYSGNIEGLTSRKELGGAVGGAVDRLARSLSRRIRLPRTRSSPT
ncbi:transmembrane protein 238a isoform X1 [Festucalex cinctus]